MKAGNAAGGAGRGGGPLRRALEPEVRAGLALAVLTAVTFLPVCWCDFVNFDDPQYASRNFEVQGGLSPAGVAWAFTTTHAGNWHPLTWLSLQFDADLFGSTPAGFHATNLVLHVGNVLLLYGVLVRATGRWPPSALTAALFAVHPLHVESVAWVAERKDVLSTFLGLLAVAAYVRYARRPSVRRGVAVLAASAASLLAKPMLVTLPFVLLLLDFWPLRRLGAGRPASETPTAPSFAAASLRRLVAEKVPLFALAAASCVVTFWAQQAGGAVKSLGHFPLPLRLANAVDAAAAYLGRTVWPAGLAVYYPFPRDGLPPPRVALDAALLLSLTALAVWQARARPYLLVGWLWYLGTLVPVVGLVQVGQQARADRYTYVPLAGVFLALAWALWEALPAGRRAVGLAVAAALVLPPCVLLTRAQIVYWADSLALWEHTLAVTRDNPLARTNHAHALYEAGREEEAQKELEEAVRLRPDMDAALALLGLIHERHGRREEALACYRAAAAARPDYAPYRALAERLETSGPGPPE